MQCRIDSHFQCRFSGNRYVCAPKSIQVFRCRMHCLWKHVRTTDCRVNCLWKMSEDVCHPVFYSPPLIVFLHEATWRPTSFALSFLKQHFSGRHCNIKCTWVFSGWRVVDLRGSVRIQELGQYPNRESLYALQTQVFGTIRRVSVISDDRASFKVCHDELTLKMEAAACSERSVDL